MSSDTETLADILAEPGWELNTDDTENWYDLTDGAGDAFLRVSLYPLVMTLEPTIPRRPIEASVVRRAAEMMRRIEAARAQR